MKMKRKVKSTIDDLDIWHIWQISHLVTEMWDRVEGCPKWWDQSWRVMARWSHLDFEVQICKVELQQRI